MTSGAEPDKPYTIIFTTMSIDGRIASTTGFKKLSCPHDKQRLYLLRGRCDAVMVGANTIINDNPTLRRRLNPKTRHYYRVIVDGRLRISPEARIIKIPGPPIIILTATKPPKKWKNIETPNQLHIHTIPSQQPGKIDLKQAMKILHNKYNIQHLLVEGGGILNNHLIQEGIADELRTTITPYIIAHGPTIITSQTPTQPQKLTLKGHEQCPCKQCIHLVYTRGQEPKIPWKLQELKK